MKQSENGHAPHREVCKHHWIASQYMVNDMFGNGTVKRWSVSELHCVLCDQKKMIQVTI